MRKAISSLLFVIFLFQSLIFASAQETVLFYTSQTDIKCEIDEIHVDSYSICGNMYIPIEKLKMYGFAVTETPDSISIARNTIVYFDGDYSDNAFNTKTLPAYVDPKPVTINGNLVHTLIVDGQVVIQADELAAFGTVSYSDHERKLSISIIKNELLNAYNEAKKNDKLELLYGDPSEGWTIYLEAQTVNGIPNGIAHKLLVRTNIYGYMVDGEFEGVVYSTQRPMPGDYSLESLDTYKNGQLNGYCISSKSGSRPGLSGGYIGTFKDGKMINGKDSYTTAGGEHAYYIIENGETIGITGRAIGYETNDKTIINGKQLIFINQVKDYQVFYGRAPVSTYIPVEPVLQEAVIDYTINDEEQTVVFTCNGNTLELKVGSYLVYANNTRYNIKKPALIKDGNIYMVYKHELFNRLGFVYDSETKQYTN